MPLGMVGVKQPGTRRPLQHRCEFPCQVVRALDRAIRPAALQRGHGMGRVANEKDSAATELIGDLFGGLPRSDVHNFHVDWRPDGCEQHLAAALWCELVNGFTPTRKVGGRKNTEVVFGHNEYPVDVW